MAEDGCRVVAVSDVSGGRYDPRGLDLAALDRHLAAGGRLADAQVGDFLTNGELLTLPVDVLIPAALENAITGSNAEQVGASLIIEGANAPTTPDADAILEERGITVIPDILANAGGVVVSYLEWVQNTQAYWWAEREVSLRLRELMLSAYDRVAEVSRDQNVPMRLAAHMVGVGRVAEAMELRGQYP